MTLRSTDLSAASGLSLAATPTFAIMALATGIHGEPQVMSSMMPDASPLGGMIPMYVLMSVFHAASWLKLISQWRDLNTAEQGE